MNTSIYDKSAKGREEISTRKYLLAPRLRSLLVLVDGRRTEQQLLDNVVGLGLTAASLAQLLEQQFIVLSTSYGTLSPEPQLQPQVAQQPAQQPVQPPDQQPVQQAELDAPKSLPTQAQQFQSLYEFFNNSIKSTIGMRGFTLQLKVEKAASVDDFRALRRPYLEAVLKAKGSDLATRLAQQLDQLLANTPGQPGV